MVTVKCAHCSRTFQIPQDMVRTPYYCGQSDCK